MRMCLLLPMLCFAIAAAASPQGSGAPGPADANPALDLIPLPTHMQVNTGSLSIDRDFTVKIQGRTDPLIEGGVDRFIAGLARQTGIPFAARTAVSGNSTLTIAASHGGRPVQQPVEDESYTLDITSTGATLTAPGPLGILHGLQTFLQIVRVTPSGFAVPAVHIDDAPRFPWRGLMIDVSRHFVPLDLLKRNIDAMAAVKLNVLHLHLSDNQGFRVESKVFPKLQEMGSDDLYYTQDQIRGLISYAHDRGIRVVPEFDMPGHSTAWFVGYPDLASAPGPYSIERHWGVFDPAMDPTREQTYKFLDKFIGEMARLFPDPYFHVGGDEVNGKQWDANPEIQRFMRAHGIKSDQELQLYFMGRVEKIVAKHHKIMIGWDEILGPGLPKESVIQSWRGQDSLAAAAKQGYRGILSHGYYLDLMQPASEHYLIDPMAGDAASLAPDRQKLILGGEACMWSEWVSAENIDSRIWPRMAAIAERFWSPQDVRDVDSMYRRIGIEATRLQWLGVNPRATYFAMLGRIAGTEDDAPLRILAAVVEPPKGYSREDLEDKDGFDPTIAEPRNRLVDAVPPESSEAREFSALVNSWIAGQFKDATAAAAIRAKLATWSANAARLEPLIASSFLLKGVAPLSQNLSALGATGLQALEFIEKGEHPPDAWKAQALALVQQSKAPQAEVLLMPVDAIQALIQAAASLPSSK